MAKTQKRWIVGTKRDSTSNVFTELISKPDESLSALCIPYDSTTSVFEAINISRLGITGLAGVPGATGLASAPPGVTGLQGPQGFTGIGKQGLTGAGIQGATGVVGITGLVGATGIMGPVGGTGLGGLTGVQGQTGFNGITGYNGITGTQGLPGFGHTGLQGATGILGFVGSTGIQGGTGLAAQPIQKVFFNPISRYAAVTSSGNEVWMVSSSTVYTGLDWDRSGTSMTIYRGAHGHAAGNRVIVRNTNTDYQTALIDSTTLNSFNITTTNTDGTGGFTGGYSLGFTYAHSGNPSTGGVVGAPSGDHSDCQLHSMRIRTGTRVGTVYDLVVPASAVNGAGQNTALGDSYIPDFMVRSDSDILVGVGATMTTNILGSYSTFQFGALGNTLSRFIIVHF